MRLSGRRPVPPSHRSSLRYHAVFCGGKPKEKVFLTAEIHFLENYIALEKIRIRPCVKVIFHKEYEGEPTVPPMLLMDLCWRNISNMGSTRPLPTTRSIFHLCKGWNPCFPNGNALRIWALPRKDSGLKTWKNVLLLYGNRFDCILPGRDLFFMHP